MTADKFDPARLRARIEHLKRKANKRRAKVERVYPPKWLDGLYAEHGGKCAYCKRQVSKAAVLKP